MESVSSSSRKRSRSNSTSISTSTSTSTTTTTSSNELNTGTSTANNGLQQSCTKCRARKIKCDRKSPCSACILRGRQQECEYARTDEDRYQISQAKQIENLRKEINKLKRRLESDGPQTQSQSRGGLEVSEDHPNRRIRHPDGRVTYLWNSAATDAQMESHYKPMPMAQPVQQQHQSFGQAGFEPYSSDANMYVHNRAFPIDNTPQYGSSQYSLSQFQQNQHPDYWRGKQWHLETIYKIVCDCDEFWVPSIIDIVRNSLSPEEAIVSIRELLRSGLAGGSNNTGNYAYQSSGSSGAPYQAASASTTSASHSSSRSPDSGWSTGITDAPSALYRHAEYTGTINDNLSPTQQSQSSTEF